MKTTIENERLIIALEGRIDSANAQAVRKALQEAVSPYPGLPVVLDAGKLSFISSAGLRVLLEFSAGVPKPLTIRNVTSEVYEVFDITGFTRLFDIRRKMRSIDVSGCPVIGQGAVGTVYRLDEDTVVKVYEPSWGLDMIEKEQEACKHAFVRGIPTAISYDIVRVGDRYGTVFEMVKAENCNDLFINHPEQTDQLMHSYAELLHAVHGASIEPGVLPDSRMLYLEHLKDVEHVLPKDISEEAAALIRQMPENRHLLHGDFHMKNVLVSDGQAILIDMEKLCTGDPVFEFAGLYVAYVIYSEDDPGDTLEFFGMESAVCEKFYNDLLRLYLDTTDEAVIAEAQDKISLAGYLHFLYLMLVLGQTKPELLDRRVQRSVSQLRMLLKRVKSLNIVNCA